MPRFLDIPPELCHNCATCIAVCPHGALSTGPSRPQVSPACKDCGACYDICPGRDVNFLALNRFLYPGQIPDVYFGCYTKMFLGRAIKGRLPASSSGDRHRPPHQRDGEETDTRGSGGVHGFVLSVPRPSYSGLQRPRDSRGFWLKIFAYTGK